MFCFCVFVFVPFPLLHRSIIRFPTFPPLIIRCVFFCVFSHPLFILFVAAAGAKITGGQRLVYNVTAGTKVPIECDARGQPLPKIELFIGDRSVSDLKKLSKTRFLVF